MTLGCFPGGCFLTLMKKSLKKMEVLLILPLYLTLFLIRWHFRHVIKSMADVVNIIKAITGVENILNDDDNFGDIVDTSKEGVEQHKKTRRLKECHRQVQGVFIRG